MMAFDFFSIASSVKAGSFGSEGAAGTLSLAVREGLRVGQNKLHSVWKQGLGKIHTEEK